MIVESLKPDIKVIRLESYMRTDIEDWHIPLYRPSGFQGYCAWYGIPLLRPRYIVVSKYPPSQP